jgi:hypothetical protein
MRSDAVKSDHWVVAFFGLAVLLLFAVPSFAKDGIRIPRDHTLKIVGGVPYLMQSTYIWNPRRRGSGVDVAFSIHAYLPDLRPLGPTNRSLGDTVEGLDFMFQISLDEPEIPIFKGFENMSCSAIPVGALEEIALAVCPTWPRSEIFALFKKSDFVGFVVCNDRDKRATRCDLRAYHRSNRVLVSFARVYLPEIHGLLLKIEHLLDGFVSAADAARSESL